MSDAELLQRLRKLDCCAVSDALDKLGLGGQVTTLARQSGEEQIAGVAITVKLGTGDPPPGSLRHLGTTAIEAAGPDNIIVVEQRSGIEAGCWGGLLSLGASVKGVQGVIADGPVRDIDEARGYGFPVFANKLTSLTARGRVVEKGTNLPVTIDNVTVKPGAFVIADGSAVIFIAREHIAAVLDAAETIAAREKAMAQAIHEGRPMSEVMGGNYETMLEKE